MDDQETPDYLSKLMTPAEVAALFRVDPKTVLRWAKTGKLTSIRTLGGHRRYKGHEVAQLLRPELVRGSGEPAAGTKAARAGAQKAPDGTSENRPSPTSS